MQIKAQDHEIILQKLNKIKCSTGCLNNINYIVFGYGLYCTACLSTFSNLSQDQFINLADLSEVVANLSKQYTQKTKGEASQINVVKGQIESSKAKVHKFRDNLSYDVKTIKSKANNLLDQLYQKCLRENQNNAMQAIYEPDLSQTSIVNQSGLLNQNLKNLKVVQNGKQIKYVFTQSYKKPEKMNVQTKKRIKDIRKELQSIRNQSNAIIDNFREQIKQ